MLKSFMITMLLMMSFSVFSYESSSVAVQSCLSRSDTMSIDYESSFWNIDYNITLNFVSEDLGFEYFTNDGIDIKIFYSGVDLSRSKTQFFSNNIVFALHNPQNFINRLIASDVFSDYVRISTYLKEQEQDQELEALNCAVYRLNKIIEITRDKYFYEIIIHNSAK